MSSAATQPANWVAFLRGINVGGHGKLPMKELVAVLESLGLTNVQTYVQSGNAVFTSRGGTAADWSAAIGEAILQRVGFSPAVCVMDAETLREAAAGNPYPAAASAPATLHLFFLARKPDSPDLEALDRLKTATESYCLVGPLLYLHAPDGIGRSKLAGKVERLLGVETTARNWRTVLRMIELADGVSRGP